MSRRIVLEIPDPSLVVLIGAAGAGKTTFACRHFDPGEVLSSDAFREAIAGDPGDQRATAPAFAALHRTLSRRLAAGRLLVVDATNVLPGSRQALVRRARMAGVPAVAIVLDLPPDLVLARNAGRTGRTVPRATVEVQLDDLARSQRAGSLSSEGFAAIHRFADPADVEAVAIVRTGPSASGPAASGPRASASPARGGSRAGCSG